MLNQGTSLDGCKGKTLKIPDPIIAKRETNQLLTIIEIF
jgi:hypothetical protein